MSLGSLIIRADASAAIGTGHVMRCLALAQAWRDAGGTVTFAMAESTCDIDARLQAERFATAECHFSSEHERDALHFARFAADRAPAWVVIDGYHLHSAYQAALKRFGIKVLVIDDCAQCDHYFADLIVDQNPHADEAMYANREPHTRLLLGPRFAMLRHDFQRYQGWRREIPKSANRLLITMGGSDPDKLTLRLIASLRKICVPNLSITVVAGGSNPYSVELRQAIAETQLPIRFLSQTERMPELMAESDVAVICGGGTLWELLSMGCAVMSYSRTPEQAEIVAALERIGAVRNLGAATEMNESRLVRAVAELLASHSSRSNMARIGRNLVDCKGISRILEHLSPEEVSMALALSMVPVKSAEREEFLQMARQHFCELNPAFTPAADWKNSYFENISNNPGLRLRWIVVNDVRVGFILFGVEDHRFLPRKTGAIYELYVLPAERRKGIARACAMQAIAELRDLSPSKIQLEVMMGNTAACELWKSLGFREVTERLVLSA